MDRRFPEAEKLIRANRARSKEKPFQAEARKGFRMNAVAYSILEYAD
jgi:hypothetical protein